MGFRSLGWEDPLEKGMATHASILTWRISWTVQSMGSQRVGHDFHFPFLSFMAVQYVPVVSSASFGLFFLQACMVFSQAYSDSIQLKAQGSPLYTSGAISQCSSLYSSTLFYKHQPCWLFLTQLHLNLETAGTPYGSPFPEFGSLEILSRL